MIFYLNTLMELTRSNKIEQFNCYTSLADINLYADTQFIIVTIQSTQNPACDIPHSIKVTLQIDVLGAYEPYVYVRDYDYATTSTIRLKCNDASCSTIANSASGIIYIESKTKVTKIPVGSVRISRGVAENCFNDNETFVELQQGSVVLNTVPTFNCLDDIAIFSNGVWTLKPVHAAKLYITYSDDTMSIHQDLIVGIQANIVEPTSQVIVSSIPVKIKLSNPTISTWFNQSIVNGIPSKDTKYFQFDLFFITDILQPTPIMKVAQVKSNSYTLSGFLNRTHLFHYKLLTMDFLLKEYQDHQHLLIMLKLQLKVQHRYISHIFFLQKITYKQNILE
ncbi:Conserved_hypothetical protein [Hexamita inflata]|uniref:Uncharacterized protein n=1 Tax=Hexamita inflata TaxID=28002 RepID=A0AA86TFX6_9EUKA|nr:Conserved hypothetical protein [Hexamita inflata]